MIRLFKIIGTVAKNRLDNLIDLKRLPFIPRLMIQLLPWRYLVRNDAPRGVRIRLSMEELGPIFVKFGQILSTRRDLLPDDISDELAKLQDSVPSFPVDEAVDIIEEGLGSKVGIEFERFDREPLASASVAQVHSARLHSGDEVVVKVIRPRIKGIIRKDIRLMYIFAWLLVRISKEARRLRPVEVVSDYEKTIMDELDLLREAANTCQLRRNFLSSHLLFVPRVYWDYCRPNAMVVERVYGVPISDVKTLRARGTDMKKLAERGVELFFTQVLRDRFFHADMHPGNIFIDIDNPSEPRYIGIDCGIVGTLESGDQRYLAGNLLAFFQRDYRKVAQLHIDSGWVPRETHVSEFEAAIRTVCEPIFEKPLKDISFGQLLVRLFQTARRFNMEIQPQLVLLEKTLLNVEGLGRMLYPDLDLWSTAHPFLVKWMKDQVRPLKMIRSFKESSAELLLNAPGIANQVKWNIHQLAEQHGQFVKVQVATEKRSARARTLGLGVLVFAICVLFFPEEFKNLPILGVFLSIFGVWLLAS